jgi:prevent-host-death family protein
MARRSIPQRELRNDVARILREAEAGAEFTVTVRGRPVAHLGPAEEKPARRANVDSETLQRIFAATPVDDSFAEDIAELREAESEPRDAWDR